MALAALGFKAGLALAALAALGFKAGLALGLALGFALGLANLLGDVVGTKVNKTIYLVSLPCCLGFLWLLWLEIKIPFGPRFC